MEKIREVLTELGREYLTEFNRWNGAYEAGKREDGKGNELCDELRVEFKIKIETITEIAVQVLGLDSESFLVAIQ